MLLDEGYRRAESRNLLRFGQVVNSVFDQDAWLEMQNKLIEQS